MLSEQVVEAIDRLALEQNTNRSRLINEILADYLSLVTPEKHIADVFRSIESLFDRTELIAAHAMNDNTLSLKSSLVYRYRPTIRYEVELFRTPERNIGQLKVNFRTQSPDLIVGLTEFFRLWARLENTYVLKLFPENALIIRLTKRGLPEVCPCPSTRVTTPTTVQTPFLPTSKFSTPCLKSTCRELIPI